MRTDVKLGLAVALALTVAAGWYFSRSDGSAAQVPLNGSDGVMSTGAGDKSPATNSSRGNRNNPPANRPAHADAGRPGSDVTRPSGSAPATQSRPVSSDPSTTPRGTESADARGAPSNPPGATDGRDAAAANPSGAGPTDRRTDDATRAGAPRPANSNAPANAGTGSPLPTVGNQTPKASTEVHTSKAGDTFEQLAQLYYGDARYAASIRSANPALQHERSLPTGASVVIPDVQPLPVLSSPQPERAVSALPTVRDSSSPGRGAVPVTTNASSNPAPASMKIYTVREGDSLYAIARTELSAGTRWKEIYDLNKSIIGGDPAQLKVGMVLKVPAR